MDLFQVRGREFVVYRLAKSWTRDHAVGCRRQLWRGGKLKLDLRLHSPLTVPFNSLTLPAQLGGPGGFSCVVVVVVIVVVDAKIPNKSTLI